LYTAQKKQQSLCVTRD